MLYTMYLYRGFSFTMCLYRGFSFTMCLYKDFSFTMYLYKDLLFIMHLYWGLLYIMYLYRGFLFTVYLQGFSFIVYLYRGLLSYLLFFRSVKICLCFPLLGNFVFKTIGLPCFRRVLDSFANYPTRSSIHARIFKNLNVWLHHFLY